MKSRDVIIVGAGPNGLVAAFYLARAGHKPLVLERRPVIGGSAVTEEFHPGFRASLLDAAFGPLVPAVARDMRLVPPTIEWLAPQCRVFAPARDARPLTLHAGLRESAQAIAAFSQADAAKYIELAEILDSARAFLRDFLTTIPPEIDHPSASDIWNLLRAGKAFRKLGKQNMRRLLRWGPMAAADFVAEFFVSEPLRAVMAAPGIFGAAAGPWSAGTAAPLLLRLGAGGFPDGAPLRVRGGMGALSEAMAAAARQADADIRTGAEVDRILVKEGVAVGVVLKSGEEIFARAVVSAADPQRTFLKLIEPVHLAPGFLQKVRNYRSRGIVARILLALDALPHFTTLKNLPPDQQHAALATRIHIAPDIDYLERAFDDSKYGAFSRAPFLEASIPSLLDPSLAPAGKHVMAVHMQYAPYKLKAGDWNSQRDTLADTVIKTLAEYAPDLPSKIIARRIITSLDLENDYALTGGHIFHGELALDQLFVARPLLGIARYAAPLRGLFLCGSGTHPGIGLAAASALNAARQTVKSLRHSSSRKVIASPA